MTEQTQQSGAETLERVATALADLPYEKVDCRDGMPSIEVERASLKEALTRLRDAGAFEQATFVTAIDHYPDEPRYELNHQLLSFAHNDRLRVKCRLQADDAQAPTCIDLWPGAAYMERECFDMFGIVFEGHEGLKRLLMPEGYDHHPLKKDFPHQGIEPDRLYREWDAKRRQGWSPEE